MLCYRKEYWSCPLWVAPDNAPANAREIHAFYVFDETGIILTHDRGWFVEKGGNFNLDISCVKKVKQDFKCKTAFLLSRPARNSWDDNEYDVYIPAFALDIHAPRYEKHDNRIDKIFDTKIESVKFTQRKFLDGKLWEIWNKLSKETEKLSKWKLDDTPSDFQASLKLVNKLTKDYLKEKEYIKNYTCEMAIQEGF